MRTTLTLDTDIALAVRKEMQARDASLKETVNALLRMGLEVAMQPKPRPEKFVVRAKPLGTGLGTRHHKVSDLLESAEGELYR